MIFINKEIDEIIHLHLKFVILDYEHIKENYTSIMIYFSVNTFSDQNKALICIHLHVLVSYINLLVLFRKIAQMVLY